MSNKKKTCPHRTVQAPRLLTSHGPSPYEQAIHQASPAPRPRCVARERVAAPPQIEGRGMSLNGSQRGNCSTEYNTLAPM